MYFICLSIFFLYFRTAAAAIAIQSTVARAQHFFTSQSVYLQTAQNKCYVYTQMRVSIQRFQVKKKKKLANWFLLATEQVLAP